MIGSGLGSAFGQMMQGDMNAQQMNRQGEQADRQAEQFNMLKTQFDQSQQTLYKQGVNEGIEAAEGGDWSVLQGLEQTFPGFSGGEMIRAVNTSDFPNSVGGGITEGVRNRFASDTGSALPLDDKEAREVLAKSGVIDGEGVTPTFITANQLGQGLGSGYANYKHQKELQEQILLGKIKGKVKDEVSEMDYISLDNKIKQGGFSSLTPMEQSAFNLGTEKFKMSKPQARGQLYSEDSTVVHNTIDKGENLDGIDDATMNFYLSAEDANGSTPKNKVKIQDTIGSIDAISSIQRDWANLSTDEIASGITENAMVDVAKLASTEEFQSMNVDQQKKELKTLALRSKTGMFGAKFLNAISGAAVSEEEYERIMGILTGGKINQVGVDTIVSALGGAAEGLYDDASGKIKAIGKAGTGSKIELSKSLQRAYDLDDRPIVSTGDKTIDDIASGAVSEQAEQALQAAGNTLSTVTEPIKQSIDEGLESLPIIGDWYKSYKESQGTDKLSIFKGKISTMNKAELKELRKSSTSMSSQEKRALNTAFMKTVRG